MFISFGKNAAEVAFMASCPGSPIMLKALESGISNIMQRIYTNHRLGITGNIMFEKILKTADDRLNLIEDPASLTKEAIAINAKWREDSGQKIALLPIARSNERIIFGDDILWQRQAIPSSDWPRPATYYADLWNQN